MEIGTAETNIGKKKRKLKPSLSSGIGSDGGPKNPGGGGNSGGGDNFPGKENSEHREEARSNKMRITMGFLLLVVLMTFGVLIGAYIVTATNGVQEWKPENLPMPIWISTFLILASSLTYKFFQSQLFKGNQQKAKNWLLATTVLGAAFISSQILAWLALSQRGVYVQSNPYAGFFYILTAVHAVHVIVGIIVLGYIVLRTWNKTDAETELISRKNISNTVGWYWHFMGALWLVLVLLLGFFK